MGRIRMGLVATLGAVGVMVAPAQALERLDGTDGGYAGGILGGVAITPSASSVAFSSTNDALDYRPGNGHRDVFVYDRFVGQIRHISTVGGGDGPEGDSTDPFLSDDGFDVAYTSGADVSGTGGPAPAQAYRWRAYDNVLVSAASDGTRADGPSRALGISADGNVVAFASDGANLVAGDTNARPDVFVRDMRARTTTRVSVDEHGDQLPAGTSPTVGGSVISADGDRVAFLAADGIRIWSRSTGTSTVVAPRSAIPTLSLSRDGSAVVFNATPQEVRVVRPGAATTVVNQGNQPLVASALSPNGKRLGYAASGAFDSQLRERDLTTGADRLLSDVGAGGLPVPGAFASVAVADRAGALVAGAGDFGLLLSLPQARSAAALASAVKTAIASLEGQIPAGDPYIRYYLAQDFDDVAQAAGSRSASACLATQVLRQHVDLFSNGLLAPDQVAFFEIVAASIEEQLACVRF